MYFIHNRYDEESRRQLKELSEDVIVIDFYEDYEKYSKLKGLEPLPCRLESLEYEQDMQKPTAEELYRAANLLNQAEILANQRQQDKVMAAILLEQVGGEPNV